MLRFDDQFPIHRKLAGLSDAAFRLHIEALFWCARHLTDGVVGQEELDVVSAKLRRPIDLVPSLVGRDAWHRFEGGQITSGCAECEARYQGVLKGDGWVIHGYLDWQQPRSKVLQIREARKKAGQLGGKRSASSRASNKGGSKSAGQGKRGSKPEANAQAKPTPVASPPIPSPSSKGIGDARPASPGEASVPQDPTNGRPTIVAKPPDLADVRAQLAAASSTHRAKANRRTGAFDALMAATEPAADQPPITEPEIPDA
jgi:hypothetical protein